MRGRKKTENPNSEVVSIRITKKQKEILDKNKWIKKEITRQVRNHINIYVIE